MSFGSLLGLIFQRITLTSNAASVFICYFSFMLAPCITELDISMIDRLSPVFNGSPFTSSNENVMADTTAQPTANANLFSIALESASIDLRLRFPCTDLRPIHTPDRVPWWKRNVLRDSLYITFHEAKLSYQSNRYEIVANKFDIYYSVSKVNQSTNQMQVIIHSV